jgi:predicted nucleic acid-binding protein
MITTKFALDTNILIYSHDKNDLYKQDIARNLIVQMPVISTQSVDVSTLKMAKQIIQRYDLQIFDSIIAASAIESNCKVLYSEDMKHNLDVNGFLKIINPFL